MSARTENMYYLQENSLEMEVEQNEKFVLQHKGQMGFYQAVPA